MADGHVHTVLWEASLGGRWDAPCGCVFCAREFGSAASGIVRFLTRKQVPGQRMLSGFHNENPSWEHLHVFFVFDGF